MLTKDDVVYKLEIEDRKPVLRFVIVSTRKIATHDEAANLPDIPDIFIPTSLPGMAQAVWKANCLPMLAIGAMFDAGYHAVEDIDRLDILAKEKVEEEKSRIFEEIMADFAKKASKVLEANGAFKGPWPASIARDIAMSNEYKRRKMLAAEKMKAAYEAQTNDAGT